MKASASRVREDWVARVLVLSLPVFFSHTLQRSGFGVFSLEEIAVAAGIQVAIDALENGRLALICGAGLSMDPPSSIPSAQALADQAKQKYDATHGAERPPLAVGIEEQATFFYAEGHLADYYLRTLIGRHAFSAEPNAGHYAVADLLLTRGADLALSTNVERLIETAGVRLGGHIESVIDLDREALADLMVRHLPVRPEREGKRVTLGVDADGALAKVRETTVAPHPANVFAVQAPDRSVV